MDRVDSLGSSNPFRRPEKKKAKRKRTGEIIGKPEEPVQEDPLEFAAFIDAPAKSGTLEELLDGVTEAGDGLRRQGTLENIRVYRQAVKSFLRFIVDHVLDVDEHTSGVNILKRKKFTLIRVIDQKLEGLANAVLSGQSDQLEVLRRLEEINGLLVDLTT